MKQATPWFVSLLSLLIMAQAEAYEISLKCSIFQGNENQGDIYLDISDTVIYHRYSEDSAPRRLEASDIHISNSFITFNATDTRYKSNWAINRVTGAITRETYDTLAGKYSNGKKTGSCSVFSGPCSGEKSPNCKF